VLLAVDDNNGVVGLKKR